MDDKSMEYSVPHNAKIYKISVKSGSGLMSYYFHYFILSNGKPYISFGESCSEVTLKTLIDSYEPIVDNTWIDKRLEDRNNRSAIIEVLKQRLNK